MCLVVLKFILRHLKVFWFPVMHTVVVFNC